MKDKEPPATILTRDPALRAEFIELLKTGMRASEIEQFMGVSRGLANASLKRLLWETAFQLANEDEIAKLWTCITALTQRLADLEKRLNME